MPRVNLSRKNYIEKDLAEILIGMVKTRKVKQEAIAMEWGVTQASVSVKLRSGRLTVKELILLMRLIEANDTDWNKVIGVYK